MNKTPWGHVVTEGRQKQRTSENRLSIINPKLWTESLLKDIYESDKRLKAEFESFDSYYSYYQEITRQK